jgi:hypothetical protein
MANGLLDVLGSALGTTPPSYMEGLLGAQATEDLRKRSIGSGIVNALVGYAAMPKNQNLGLGRILAGTAQAGMAGAKGVYDTALQDYQTQAKIDEMARKRQQDLAGQQAINTLLQDPKIANDPMAVAFIKSNPSEALKVYATPKERKTATVGNKVIDTSTGQEIYVGEKELKALPTYTVERGRTKYTYQIQPDGTEKLLGQSSMDAAKEPKSLYSNTAVDTGKGYVYMPTAEAAAQGYKPIDINTGKPVTYELTGKEKAPTDQQLLSKGFLTRMKSSNDIFGSQVVDPETGKLITLEQAAGKPTFWDTKTFASPERQQYRQAQEEWVRAKLRKESGAVIGAQEMEDEINTYFPSYWDDATTIAQKRHARRVAENAMDVATGSDVKPVKPFKKTFDINKKKIPATLGSDDNYYYIENGKTYIVKE